jgi:hypothetical protein
MEDAGRRVHRGVSYRLDPGQREAEYSRRRRERPVAPRAVGTVTAFGGAIAPLSFTAHGNGTSAS